MSSYRNSDISSLSYEELKELDSQLRKPHGKNGILAGERMNEGNVNMYKITIDEILKEEYKSALELGFGTGKLMNELLGINPDILIHGIDYSHLMVDEAIKLNTDYIRENRTELFHGTIEELPFENSVFDLVYTVNTFYFWDNPNKCFDEIKRVLKPGGTFINTMRTQARMKYFPVGKYQFKHYYKEEVIELFRNNGFSIKSDYYLPDGVLDLFCVNTTI